MSADHGLSERAYTSLKFDLIEGRLPAGRINIGQLADRYSTSTTPIREAMLRLVGESLLDMPSAGGFEIRALDEAAVRHLYVLSQYVMLNAAACRSRVLVDHDFEEESIAGAPPAIELLFDSLAKGTQNAVLAIFVRNLNDRMRRIRRAEEGKLNGLGREFSTLRRQIEHGNRQSIRRSVIAYHRRRIRNITEIMSAIPC
ncbi:GntR family transcriptional regulator [Sphingopyxis sp. 22461]|uniref:GntR family transcriptional regulator n=1 Tax=Sphingopyxis sp. 22461 TaxID=3453923 RepID=UPI003F876C28